MNVIVRNILLITITVSCLFSGCKGENDVEENGEQQPEVETLELSTSFLSFGKGAESQSFSITSNAQWTADSDADWLIPGVLSGNGNSDVTVSVLENSGEGVRQGAITVTSAGGITETVTVSQGGSDPYIMLEIGLSHVEISSISFSNAAASHNISIASNSRWIVSKPSAAAWLSVTPERGDGNGSITVSVNDNNTNDIRSSAVTITTESGITKPIQVRQVGTAPAIIIDRAAATASPNGEDITVSVTASRAWTPHIPQGAEWITVKSKSETQAVFAVAQNTSEQVRSTNIVFKLDENNIQESFSLTQQTWHNITHEAGMLQNVKKPFATGNHFVVISGSPRYFEALHWTTNAQALANGNIDIVDGGSHLLFWTWDALGPAITNGKLYQTVTLEAGSYKFDVVSDGNPNLGAEPNLAPAYVVAATGAELPDIANIQSALVSQRILPTQFTEGARLSIEFTLTATTQVHLGFVVTVSGRQQIYFNEVQLWELR